MDRGAWRATAQGAFKESDMSEHPSTHTAHDVAAQ